MTDRTVRVLLIDGRVDDAQWLQELLAELEENRFGGGWRHGVEIFALDRLSDALVLLNDAEARSQIDVVLLNPTLPDSAGLHTLTKLRNHSPDMPVVILANHDDPDLAVSMVRAGAQDFLIKPELDSVPLARSLRLAVERGRILRDLLALASHDPLTGLLNRNGFLSAAGQDADSASRLGLSLAVMALEATGLDKVSRQYGREEAHIALMEAADALREAASAQLPLARVAPERFAISIVAVTREAAESLIANIQRRFQRFLHKANRGAIHPRLGVAWLRKDASEDLLCSAERSLCENVGENRPVIRRQNVQHEVQHQTHHQHGLGISADSA